MLRTELYRVFKNWNFLLAISLTLLVLLHGIVGTIYWPHPANSPSTHRDAYEAILYAQSGFFKLLGPLFPALAFAGTLVQDRAKGYLSFVLTRTSYRRYLLSKWLANALAGGLVLALSLLLMFSVSYLIYGTPPPPEPGHGYYYPGGYLSELAKSQPNLYVCFLIAMEFLFGATFATLGLAIATRTDNLYVIFAAPYLFYIGATYLIENLGFVTWSPMIALVPHDTAFDRGPHSVLLLLGLILATTLAYGLFTRREYVYA